MAGGESAASSVLPGLAPFPRSVPFERREIVHQSQAIACLTSREACRRLCRPNVLIILRNSGTDRQARRGFYRQPNGSHLSWQFPNKVRRIHPLDVALSWGTFLFGTVLGLRSIPYPPSCWWPGKGGRDARKKSKPIGNRPVPCLERTTPCKLSQEKKKSGGPLHKQLGVPSFPRIPPSTESAPRAQGPDFFSHFTFTPCCALKVPARHPVLVSSIHKKNPPLLRHPLPQLLPVLPYSNISTTDQTPKYLYQPRPSHLPPDLPTTRPSNFSYPPPIQQTNPYQPHPRPSCQPPIHPTTPRHIHHAFPSRLPHPHLGCSPREPEPGHKPGPLRQPQRHPRVPVLQH